MLRRVYILADLRERLAAPGSVLRGSVLSVVGAGGNRALQIGALLVVAARFDPHHLSMVSAVVLWSSILGLAIAPGFSLPLTAAIAGARIRSEQVTSPVLFMFVAAAFTVAGVAVLIWLSAEIAPAGLSSGRFALLLAIMATGFCLQAIALGGLIAERAYGMATGSSLLLGASQIIAPLLAGGPSMAVTLMAGGAMIAAVLSTAMVFVRVRAGDRDAKRGFTHWRQMARRIPPSLVASSVVEPTNLIVLTYIFGNATPPVGSAVIAVAQQWMALFLFIPSVVNQILLPQMMQYAEAARFAGFRRKARRILVWNAVVVSIPAAMLIAATPFLLSQYQLTTMEYPFILLIGASWINSLAFPCGTILAGLGRFELSALGNALWSSIFIVASILLSHRSTDGFAEARVLSYVAHLLSISSMTLLVLHRLPTYKADEAGKPQ